VQKDYHSAWPCLRYTARGILDVGYCVLLDVGYCVLLQLSETEITWLIFGLFVTETQRVLQALQHTVYTRQRRDLQQLQLFINLAE